MTQIDFQSSANKVKKLQEQLSECAEELEHQFGSPVLINKISDKVDELRRELEMILPSIQEVMEKQDTMDEHEDLVHSINDLIPLLKRIWSICRALLSYTPTERDLYFQLIEFDIDRRPGLKPSMKIFASYASVLTSLATWLNRSTYRKERSKVTETKKKNGEEQPF